VTVLEFQQTLNDLCRLLSSAGMAGTKVGELTAFAAGLDPFKDQQLKAFTATLARTGTGDTQPQARKEPTPKVVVADPTILALAADAKRLYDRAADPTTTEAQVDDLCRRISGLKIPGIKTVAAAIDFQVPSKSSTKAAIVGGIRHRIVDRMDATIRRQVIDRPAAANGVGVSPAPSQP